MREELTVAGTVQVLVLLSTEEQLKRKGVTPRRPGRVGREGREGRGSGGWGGEENRTG